MSHNSNRAYASVSSDPNTIASLQSGHNILLAAHETSGETWRYIPGNAAGSKWEPLGPNAFINESVMYKAFANAHPNINGSTTFQTLFYKAAPAGTYDTSAFIPVANGVQVLKDLENITIVGSHFVVDNVGQRTSLGIAVAINGAVSDVEATGYIRRISGSNEDLHQVIETFPTLSAGDVITIQGRRQGVASANANGIEDKGILSVLGFVPNSPGVITGFPLPIVTSISTT